MFWGGEIYGRILIDLGPFFVMNEVMLCDAAALLSLHSMRVNGEKTCHSLSLDGHVTWFSICGQMARIVDRDWRTLLILRQQPRPCYTHIQYLTLKLCVAAEHVHRGTVQITKSIVI